MVEASRSISFSNVGRRIVSLSSHNLDHNQHNHNIHVEILMLNSCLHTVTHTTSQPLNCSIIFVHPMICGLGSYAPHVHRTNTIKNDRCTLKTQVLHVFCAANVRKHTEWAVKCLKFMQRAGNVAICKQNENMN